MALGDMDVHGWLWWRRWFRQPLLQLHAPAICFSGGSQQVCLASNPPNASAGFQGNNSYSYTVATTCPCHLFFRGFKTAVCPASNPPNASNPPAGLQGNNSYSYYMPLPSVFQGFKTAVCPPSNPPNMVDAVAPAAVGVAGVALGDIDVHFAWQAWHLVTWTCTLRDRRGTYGTGLALVARLVPAAGAWRRHGTW